MQETNIHSVTIEQQKNISVTAVESVLAFSDTKIVLSIVGGTRMHVSGMGLKISGFSKTNGTFTATGKIIGVSYGGKNFAAKLFK